MKVYYIIILALFFSLKLTSQEALNFFGAIKLSDSTYIDYKLVISEKNGKISGYSITDQGGEHETRSNVFGEYDDYNNELSFRETNIVYTKSSVSQNDFCFVNSTFKNFKFNRTKKAEAPFMGLFSDNTKCAEGELVLILEDKIEKRLQRVEKIIKVNKKIPDSIKQAVNVKSIVERRNNNILRKDQVLSVFSKKDHIKLIIYDGGKIDGDKIEISVNGKNVLSNFEAVKEKKELTLALTQPKMTVKIKALSEGSITPNTVIVEMDDGQNKLQALSNLKKGESTQIDILKR